MAINPNLLIAAPMLQDYFVDKVTGFPLAGGIITLYQDQARSIYKNWYYQTGSPGAYTYIPLDNPLHLSSVGTIQDPAGNDVIPFYYPYDENDQTIQQAYYITVYSVDQNGDPATLQFTRENFPFQPTGSPGVQVPTLRNYILNNVYWRNIGTTDLTDKMSIIVSPSQHEGYTNGDISFIKDVAGATDTISFLPMTQTLENDITPEVCLNMQCTAAMIGETVKCIQYPLSLHVKTLQNQLGTIVFHGQNVAGGNNYVDIQVYAFLGTGAITQPVPVTIQRITLTEDFQKYLIPVILPDTQGLDLGVGGDDAFFIRVQFPLALTFNISHTKPQFYLSDTVPDNDFDTYDQIETIINSPRTGDYKQSLNVFLPGYIAANDGSIGSPSSGASDRANIDTWPIYNLLWNGTSNIWCPISGGRGASAYADFSMNKALTLMRNLGRVIAGLNPIFDSPVTFTADSTTDILTLSTATTLVVGTPVCVINSGGALPSPLINTSIYFICSAALTSTTVTLSTTLDNAYAGINIDILSNGSGTNTLYSAMGASQGESAHTQNINEMPSHNHPGSTIGTNPDHGVGSAQSLVSNQGTLPPDTFVSCNEIAFQGNGQPFNIIQPTVYGYIFIKL
jgi:hypothetical protein